MSDENLLNYVEPMEMEEDSGSNYFLSSEEETEFHAKNPPNKKLYKSLDESLNAFGRYAARERFAFIKKSTSKDSRGKVRICVISCDRGGIPTSTRSKKTDCQYQLSLSRRETVEGQEEWSILFDESKSLHNHPRLKEKVGHTAEHRLSQQQYQTVCQMEENKNSREEILQFLKITYPKKQFTYTLVHNAIHKYKRKLSLCNEFFNYIHDRRCDDYLCEKIGGPKSRNFIFTNKKSIESFGITKIGILAIHSSYESDIFGGTIIEVTHLSGCFAEMPFCTIFMTSNSQNKYPLAVKSIKGLFHRTCGPAFIITQENAMLMDAIERYIPEATNLIGRTFINAMIKIQSLKPITSRNHTSLSDSVIIDTWDKLVDESNTLGDLKERFQNFAQNLGDDFSVFVKYLSLAWINRFKFR
jgi:hypothetical protein